MDKATEEFVGTLALSQPRGVKNRDAMLAITLDRSKWGKGYGPEALEFLVDYGFKQLALHRISLWTFATNVRAYSVYKKLYVFVSLSRYLGTADPGKCAPEASLRKAERVRRLGRTVLGWT